MIYEAGQRVGTFDELNLKSLVSDLFSNLKSVPHSDFRKKMSFYLNQAKIRMMLGCFYESCQKFILILGIISIQIRHCLQS